MKKILTADRMEYVHSDIRGPLFYEAMDLQRQGINVLKLNTGNPATFGFKMPDSIYNALSAQEHRAVGYCDFRGMEDARASIAAYHRTKGLDVDANDVFIGNGVSEVVSFALQSILNEGDEVLVPTPCYSLWSNSVHLCGAKPVFYVCDEQADWNPDCADILKKITPKTRAIGKGKRYATAI